MCNRVVDWLGSRPGYSGSGANCSGLLCNGERREYPHGSNSVGREVNSGCSEQVETKGGFSTTKPYTHDSCVYNNQEPGTTKDHSC